jgi:UDPglucose 6-dehydrogenase
VAYDPAAGERASEMLPGLEVRTDAYDAATDSQVVALLTEWDEFRWLDFDRVRTLVKAPAIVDARNMLDPAAMRRRGFNYVGVGR